MKPKHLGLSILAISIIIIGILFWFNNNLTEQNLLTCNSLCGEGDSCSIESCPFNSENNNSSIFILIIGLLVAFSGGIGFYLITLKEEKIIEQKEYDITKLNNEEKELFLFIKENKRIYQSKIIEKFNFPKVKVTRILDKLEVNNLIERKRRGMSNIIVLK